MHAAGAPAAVAPLHEEFDNFKALCEVYEDVHVCVNINNPQDPCPYQGAQLPYGCQNVVPLLLAKGQEMDVYWQLTAGGQLTFVPLPGTAN